MLFPNSFLDLVGIEDPQISPDSSTIVYVRTRFDLAKNRIERSLWRLRKGIAEQFTQGISDRAPRWSNDGTRIAFLRSDETKKMQLHVIATDGGEPRAIGDAFGRIGRPAWSPDGSSIAFAATMAMPAGETTVAFDEESGARHVVALPYKSDGVGLFDGKRTQIHVISLDGDVHVVGKGPFDAGDPAWSPDGKRIVFVANPAIQEGSFSNDLYAVPAQGGAIERLTSMNGILGAPAFSRDGREIAFTGNDTDDFSGRRNKQLWCVAAQGGAPRSLTPDRKFYLGDAVMSDLRAHEDGPPVWTPDDDEIVVQRSYEGACTLVAFKRDGSASREIAGGELEIYAFSGARDGAIAFASTDVRDPGSIAILQRDGRIERVANENAAWLEAHPPIVPERIRPKADDGTVLDAWILHAPARKTPGPLVHAVHGGPHGAYGFAYFFEFQLLAALGMNVVYGNPRGSQSYGEHYADAITGRWGDLDMSDIKTILEAAKERMPIDERRIAVQGGSYGGLMTTWLLGHTRDYACGVSMRAVNDYVSEATVSDIPRFMERELNVDWSDAGQRLFELSPIRSAGSIEAPLLILHSERDFRCPIDQGEQLFGRLRGLGKIAEFVRFTGDGHDLSRNGSPRNRLLRYRALCHWLRRYLGLEKSNGGAGWLFEPLTEEAPEAGV